MIIINNLSNKVNYKMNKKCIRLLQIIEFTTEEI